MESVGKYNFAHIEFMSIKKLLTFYLADYQFFCKKILNLFLNFERVTKRQHMLRHILSYIFISRSSFE